MISKTIAIEIVEKILKKEKRVFNIPQYGILMKIPYFILVLYKKIIYRKLFLNDYEHIGVIYPSKKYKSIEEELFILEIIELEELFIFYLGTLLDTTSRHGYFGMIEESEKPLFLDRGNGNVYRLLSDFPVIDIHIKLFLDHKDTEKKFINSFRKIKG